MTGDSTADIDPEVDPTIYTGTGTDTGTDTAIDTGIDTASACAAFGAALTAAGVHVSADRVVWWAQAIATTRPTRVRELYWLGRVTLLDNAGALPVYDAVFGQVFRGLVDVADQRGEADQPPPLNTEPDAAQPDQRKRGAAEQDRADGEQGWPRPTGPRPGEADDTGRPFVLATASELELLREKDFAHCSAEELAELADLIDRMKVVAPRRPSRWVADRSSGRSVDLRRTLRTACRTGGDPINWAHRRRGSTPRPIVLLADVSGSMQPYARIYLRVLQGAVIGARAQAYVFATRLTRVSGALATGRREEAIARALAHAPDTAGGTLIGEALKTFLDTDGRRGVARGAVVVVVSDGWERADPSLLGEQMTRLSRLAYRVIWVNPRKAAPGFAPLTGGMAAALPHVDAFVAGHSASAVAELLDVIAAPT